MPVDKLDIDDIVDGARQVIQSLVQRVYDWLLAMSEQLVDWVIDHLPHWLIKLLHNFSEARTGSNREPIYAMQ